MQHVTSRNKKTIEITQLRRFYGSFRNLLSCLRFDEIIILQGTPLLGAFSSIGKLTFEKTEILLLFFASSCCLVAHVFLLNDWSGIMGDLKDPNRSNRVFTVRGINTTEIGLFAILFLLLTFLLLSFFGERALILVLGIFMTSTLYSFPIFHLKGVPILNSVLHFIGGLLHFLLGYSLFVSIDNRGLIVGCFFALIFVAGHLTQEIRDYDADMVNGIKTNAVFFGKKWSFLASVSLFTIADVLLFVLSVRGLVSSILMIVSWICLLQLYWSIQTLRRGLTFMNVQRLQNKYRILYAILGVIMVVTHYDS